MTRALGIVHTHYPAATTVPLTPLLLGKWVVFAVGVALVTTAFIELVHLIKKRGETIFCRACRCGCSWAASSSSGLWKPRRARATTWASACPPTIVRAFEDPALPIPAFALKLLFTAVTLGAGYLGGEVTPLFFVGATLGSALARWLGIPLALGAGVGLAAVFGAAANAPLALSIMAMELLGAPVFPHVVIVCVMAYLLTGHRSIYPAQRLLADKGGARRALLVALRDLDRD